MKRRGRYPEEVKAFVGQNVEGTPTWDLAEMVNKEFGLEFTESKMRAYMKNHGFRNGLRGIPDASSRLFPPAVKQFIQQNYIGIGPAGMAEELNVCFGTDYTKQQIKNYYSRNKLDSGVRGHFLKGHEPHNKGKKGINYEGTRATQFKKGQMPHNYKPVESERVNGGGYVDIKIADPNKWRPKHVLIWEAANGPVPKGHVVIFGDGDKRNFDLNNLLLVSRRQLIQMNKKGLIYGDAELTKTGILIADIHNKIGERNRKRRRG